MSLPACLALTVLPETIPKRLVIFLPGTDSILVIIMLNLAFMLFCLLLINRKLLKIVTENMRYVIIQIFDKKFRLTLLVELQKKIGMSATHVDNLSVSISL